MARLVEYPSSDEDAEPKKKLPALAASLSLPAPVDDPALHQGRVRTTPHVDGQYPAHVYVPLVLSPRDALYTLVDDAAASATAQVPAIHPIGKHDTHWELHVSLSRPLFLRAHQREDLKQAVRRVASLVAPFDASFTTFAELTNDERTRSFLAMQVGAGHAEFRRCLDLLGPALRLLRQKEFYADPKFHASIAWALLEKTGERAPSEETASPGVIEHPSDNFRRIPRFPHTLVPFLNERHAPKLSQAQTGGFIADSISVKIGKDVFTWSMNGIK